MKVTLMLTLTKDEIIALVMEEPRLLLKTGKVLNTWRLIFGCSVIPTFTIKYMEAITDTGEHVTLYDFEGTVGYNEDGIPYNISEVTRILDVDANVFYEHSYLSNLQLIEDVLYYNPESRYVTLTYLMNIETEPIYINSLPLFDHTKIKYRFKDKIVIGIDNYHLILQPIQYMNCKLNPNQYGMVKIAYNTEVPYSVFYSKKVNEQLSDVLPCVPLIEHTFSQDID